MRGVGGVRKSIHQSWLAKGSWLGLLCWSLKGVQEEIPSEEASTLQIGSVTFPPWQCTRLQLHPCQTIWPRWASGQLLTLPIVETLLPVTFAYSLSSREAVVVRLLRSWKRLWRRSLIRSHKRTSVGPCRSCWDSTTSALQPERITLKGAVSIYIKPITCRIRQKNFMQKGLDRVVFPPVWWYILANHI